MILLQHPKPHVINNIFDPPIPTETLALNRNIGSKKGSERAEAASFHFALAP